MELNKEISDILSQSHSLSLLKKQGAVDSDVFIWRKNEMKALLFGLLLLVMPLVLRLMGFDFAGWFSTYPIYKGIMLF